MADWEARQAQFCEQWSEIKAVRRVEIHVPSISASFDVRQRVTNRRVKEGSQLSRLCSVQDPLVEVLYISPVVLPETVLAYYKKLIEVRRCAWCPNLKVSVYYIHICPSTVALHDPRIRQRCAHDHLPLCP
jgi:hypothetical protein